MAMSRRSPRRRFTLIVLTLASITVLTLDFRDVPIVEDMRGGASAVVSPLRSGAEWVSTPFRNAWNGIFDYNDLADENERLKRELDKAKGSAVVGQDAAQQLDEVLDLVDIDWLVDISTVTARVISEPTSNFSYVIEIDKGSKAGIEVGMPVVTGRGLVGRIVQVTEKRAQIQLLTDPDFRVGIKVVESQQLGTARGRGNGRTLVVDTSIDPDDGVETGAALVTSGTDRSTFPASIPVGRVSSTTDASGGLVLDLFAEPYADLDDLSYVNVLLWAGPS